MARWTEKDYQDFLTKIPSPPLVKKRKGRSSTIARMSDERFDEIIQEDPKQGRGIRFELAIPPLPKRSARVAGVRNGKVISYIPKPTRKYMQYCKTMASLAMHTAGQPIYRLTVKIDILFCFRGRDDELPTHPSDGDLDNLEKAVYDSMSRVVYSDDRLISGHKNYKVCIADDSKMVVVVTPLRPSELKTKAVMVAGKKAFTFDPNSFGHDGLTRLNHLPVSPSSMK